ncbi:hypothetical protein NDU88_009015 [Pleurodeles waltl]|uniref:Uncharacterized protein n=1 Tax=Pleurodeles waltl TaxID=8319 RepID=A0AAV7PRK1_PLEWA|nr:hypothetical protein NDU88_009015 [Pleurodeles waltl]
MDLPRLSPPHVYAGRWSAPRSPREFGGKSPPGAPKVRREREWENWGGHQAPGRGRSTPGVLHDGRQLKRRRRSVFQGSHASKRRASAQRRSLVMKKKEEANIEVGTRSKDNGGKRKQHPQETQSRWLEKESHIEVVMKRRSAEQERTEGEEALEMATF